MAAWAMCKKREQEALSGRPLCCVASPGWELRGEGARLRCMAIPCRFKLLPAYRASCAAWQRAHTWDTLHRGGGRRGARGWGQMGKGGDGGGGRSV